MQQRNMFNFLFLAIGLIVGGAIIYFITKGNLFGNKTQTNIQANVMLQKIEKVFKVVTAEGHFSEVFDYSQTSSHLAGLIPSTKKALLIVNAKVLMGYDFKKCKWEIDDASKKVTIIDFPKPEILSIEPDIKYYNMENGIFNKFDNSDLTQLQQEAKAKILQTVDKSTLPSIAQAQMQELLQYLTTENNWMLQGSEKLLLN